MSELIDVRDEFDLPDDRAYLNSAYLGPLPRAALAAGAEALAAKTHPWSVTADAFFEPVARLRQLVAGLLDCDADGVALVPSASYGIATAAANIPIEAGETVVVLAEQFPSNVYTWRELAARNGTELVTVQRSADGWTDGVVDAIDDRTALVAVEACHWTDGSTVDLPVVAKACRDTGAALLVDVSQSVGAVPFPHHDVQPDVVVGVLYKWLLGPYGSAYLWMAPHLRDGRPIEHNWINRAGSEDFAGLVDYTDRFQPGARRFDSGEVSSHVNVATAVAALDVVTGWGADRVVGHATTLMDDLTQRAAALGLDVPPPGQRSPHLVGLRLPPDGPQPSALAATLADAGVHVSIRGTAVRVSVHAFNTPSDIDRLIAALA